MQFTFSESDYLVFKVLIIKLLAIHIQYMGYLGIVHGSIFQVVYLSKFDETAYQTTKNYTRGLRGRSTSLGAVTMPNRCRAFGCNTGCDRKKFDAPLSCDDASIATFHFPFKKPELLAKWKRFVSLNNWTPTNSSVLCEKHFEGHYIKRGNRTTLQWDQNPIPTIQSTMALKRPASFPPVEMLRKPPKIRNICPDQLPEFKENDIIATLDQIDPDKRCPPMYEHKKMKTP